MSAVSFESVSRLYGDVVAVDNVDFEIQSGEFFTLLGPSGSGKTTCLRMMAGFEFQSSGTIKILGEDCANKPPYDRSVNTVFQDYALFPHMNVRDNIAYGLMVSGVGTKERYARTDEMLSLIHLPDVGDRKPSQLSGGQRQRVAIARALINKPKLLLLDEPLGALDLKLREQMQIELKTLQRQVGITFVFVTHDQQEALSMSDRICIFNKGRIEQIGSPDDVYDRPESEFVAQFVGSVNLLKNAQAKHILGIDGTAMLRPERISISAADANKPSRLTGWVLEHEYLGPYIRYQVAIDDQLTLIVNQPNPGHLSAEERFARDTRVSLDWDDTAVHAIQGGKK
jgi:putative spermidine/putrescine transport system ATP-binding protein